MENKDEMRKGPWTEQEDVQLNLYVKLFGDRRWDFIAKVSGLKRTGKSCRLRWVNYLHPELKRGKMTPTEEHLIVQLHSKFGNRWSKIAEKIPGRTDNEIKNYWRTYMRKEAQKRKKATTMSASSSSSHSSSSPCNSSPTVEINQAMEFDDQCFYDSGGLEMLAQRKTGLEVEENTKVYSLDEIWNEIEISEQNYNLTCSSINSPMWDCFQSDSLWSLEGEEQSKTRMYPMIGDNFHSFLF